jgi:hypothetical protein
VTGGRGESTETAAIIYLYACASCGASGPDAKTGGAPTTYACEVPQSDPYHCPKCRVGLISAGEHAQVGEVVNLVGARPEARWVVLARAGDQITIRPLGLPSFPARIVCVAEILLRFSYERLAQTVPADQP